MKLSIIVCTFNEKDTICEIVSRVQRAELPAGWDREIIIVDNLSTDGTREQLVELERCENIQVIYQVTNKGKGHSVRRAIPLCTGDLVIPQDADLEYDPTDYGKLIDKLIRENLDVVIGSRGIESSSYHAYKLNEWGIAGLTWLTNLLFTATYTDVATCYKLMRTEKLKKLRLKGNGFNLDFELCAKFAKGGWRIGEVPIRYKARTFEQGRKMRPLRGGIEALLVILREALT
tara:strand:+ start:2713 stop:3408 length:696 start_codon:yes stop_codon:yes gene_type:complete